MPSLTFPVPVLQSGIKLTNEPPKGIRANLIRTYNDITDKDFGECVKGYEYHKLLFSLAFFHAVILERRKFGAIGWNIPYEWMNSDFITSQSQVLMYLNEQPHIPYTALRYLVAEINYGGRVTDDKDVRLIIALLTKYFTPEVMEPHYRYSSGDIYENPDQNTLDDVKEYIKKLPLEDDPQVFGLHPNADITFQQKTVREFRETLIVIHPRASGGTTGKSPDEVANSIASDIESRLPMRMDTKRAHPSTFAITDSGAMNSLGVFLAQEIARFNGLLEVMQKTLSLLQKAIRGDVVMSLELEKMYNCFLIQKVPQNWQSVAYPSLRPLASWVRDLIKRVEFINEWLVSGPRPSYWLSAFFFPQGFMTAALQTYARKTRTPIDTLRYRTDISTKHSSDITEMPANGVNIHGLFLQGAKWDWTTSRIEESDPEVLFVEMPVIWLEPFPVSQKAPGRQYQAPLYKTSLRAGELSTTGHSTNFVLFLDLPSEQDPLHWVRRGVALLCQLDD
jgi:dynein heavy chain